MFRLYPALFALAVSAGAVSAQSMDGVQSAVTIESSGTTLAFIVDQLPEGARGMMLNVSGPNEYQASVYSHKDLPKIELKDHGRVFNGLYRWEITGATAERVGIATPQNNGRDDIQRDGKARYFSVAGQFTVSKGRVMVFEDVKEEEPN